ncbi:lysophospholipid acyltransferase family protein [Falsiroseomonas selenitidurans]|uniref:lysophospholipid acyltransferase family protein n=1 Tax=Falsiroseomonas selenitidurans TaxID=2716335 RepID=UPI001F3F2042|nr:lysophospholipid acyltransferase family protein [Falsiroseomonas selenitidurans]
MRRKPIQFSASDPNGLWGDVLGLRPMGGRFRAVRRMVMLVLWTLIAIPVQALLLALPGRAHIGFAKVYHRTLCRLMGLRIQVVGEQARQMPVLFVSNHSSWLDILALGATLEAGFVGKSDIEGWPLIRTVARLGRTVFVSRRRSGTKGEADAIRARLAEGDSLILFPEGTTSDGGRVLPFRSAFMSVADAARVVQPVSIVFDRLGGLPACRRDRPLFAWYGDTDILTHFWRIARRSNSRATIVLHPPLDPAAFPDRKMLTAACADVVADACATMRQNRPARPLQARIPAPPAPPALLPA